MKQKKETRLKYAISDLLKMIEKDCSIPFHRKNMITINPKLSGPTGKPLLNKKDILSTSLFENQFIEIMNRGYSFIKFELGGILDGNLVFVITPPDKPVSPETGTAIEISRGELDKNGVPIWDLRLKYDIIEE